MKHAQREHVRTGRPLVVIVHCCLQTFVMRSVFLAGVKCSHRLSLQFIVYGSYYAVISVLFLIRGSYTACTFQRNPEPTDTNEEPRVEVISAEHF